MRSYLIPAILFIFFTGLFPVTINAEPGPETTLEIPDSIKIWDSLSTYNKISNNSLSLIYARKTVAYADSVKTDAIYLNAYMQMGEAFYWSLKDSSFIYYSRAATFARDRKFEKEKVIILLNLALLYKSAQDLEMTLNYLDSAINLAEKTRHFSVLADAYNILGNIKADIQDKEDAKAMYDSSFKIASRHSLYRQMGVALGNLSKFEPNKKLSLKKHREALSYLEKAKGTSEETGFILINIGLRYVDRPDSALNYFRQALMIGQKNNFFAVQMGACNNMAYSYLDKGDLDNAEVSIRKGIAIAEKAKDHDWLSTLYDTYADILSTKGDYKLAAAWQKKALTERVSADKKQSANQVRLLAALLDTKKKEILIQNKENEILQQTNRLQTTRFWLVVTVILIIAGFFIFYWYQQRTRMKLKSEQINSAKRIIEMEESEKGRIARELHDITGQLVMGITSEIENLEIPSSQIKDEIKDKIKSLGKSIRQISHRMNRDMMDHFTFEEMMTGQCEDVQRLSGVPIFLTLPDHEIVLPKEVVLHIYRMFQELLTNAAKYVKEGEVYINVIPEGNILRISYSDTGPGFDMEKVKMKGMGLMNIFERTKLLGGSATMDSSPGNGTNWEILIPYLSQKILA